MKQKKKQIFIISGVLLVLVALLGAAAWFMTRPEAGIENVTKDELNVEWYDENEKEFTITTAEELLEFAQLSSYYNFKGQTIKLGADIVVNEGNAEEWGTTFPEIVWDKPIDSFAGTFDGQGHTISGIYCMGYLYKCSGKGLKPLPAGLFSNTKPECVIKNFRLVNSYFEGDLQDGAGTISACGGGTFDSIYSDATLISYKYWNGGIIGKATESTTITNCWFDGDIQIIGGYARYTGGIMGRAMNKEADFVIEHCLVTGTMYNETEKTGVGMGAILGNALDSAIVKINDCFVDAELTNEYKVAVGSVYGVSEQNAIVNLTNTYATTESYERMVGAVLGTANGMPVGYEREMLKGFGGYQWTSLDFEKYWSVVEDGTPILTTFADNTPSLEGVERYVDLSWYTDEATEYVLLDKADLYGFSLLTQSWDFKDKTVKLGADIVVNEGKASAWAKEAPALEWISAGPKSKPFAGTFNGQMHTISGIYLDSDVMNTGLFSVTAEESTIKNLKLKNSYFKSEASFTGSIVGQGRGKIDTVYSDATVIASKGGIGGLVGLAYGEKGSVKNCWFAGTVTNTSNLTGERGTGGIIGTVYDEASVKVENCLNTGTVDVRAYTFNQAKEGAAKNVTPIAGGLVGWVRKKTSSLDMKDCLNTGKVLVSNAVTGGYGSILGYSDGDTTIEHTYATTESSALTAAKIKGWVLAYEEAKLTGHEGYRWTTLNFDKYWSVMEKGTPVLKSFAGKGVSTNGVARMVDTSWYDAKKDTYVLTDAADLYGFAYLSNGTDFAKKTIKLGSDIILNNGNASDWANAAPALVWRPIASKNLPFAGTFDGQMHTISGIYVNADERNSGLFSATGDTSIVKNLKLTNSYLTSTAGELGSVAGQGRGTFDTVYSEAIVVGNSANTGGLVGMGYGDKVVMEKCWFNGSVTNTANNKNNRGTGGLIGTLYDGCHADIKGCLNSGVVDVTAYKFNQGTAKKPNVTPIAGGIVGWVKTAKSSVNIDNCLSTEGVLVDQTATGGYGAVVGYSENVKETAVTATYSTVSPLAGSKVQGKIYEVSEEEITGYKGHQWTNLDFDNYWAVMLNPEGTPIVKPFVAQVPSLVGKDKLFDISWYDESKSEFVLNTMKDLNGFYLLSQTNNFSGKTVKLGKNIDVNSGNSATWANSSPEYTWRSIGNSDCKFAGIFDGQGYTISGLYQNTDSRFGGLFADVTNKAVVKNVKLSNSYFKSTVVGSAAMAAVIGRANGGTFDSIYTDDTVIVTACGAHIGGLIGLVNGDTTVNNCWNAASVTNTSTDNDGTGGIVGCRYAGKLQITHCMNSGTIDVTAYTETNNKGNVVPYAAGLVGYTNSKDTVVDDCLNIGSVLVDKANNCFGSLMGYHTATGTVTNTYGTKESSKQTGTNKAAGGILIEESKLIGYGSFAYTSLDFGKYWDVVEGETPILKTFVGRKKVLSVAGCDNKWFLNGNGSETNPYILTDPEDLYGFELISRLGSNIFEGKIVKLGKDIEVNKGRVSEWENPKAWTPIGQTDAFAGTFDGELHTISGLYCNESTKHAGLFGQLSATASVKNLKITNSYFNSTATDEAKIGAVVGYSLAKELSSIYVDATVTVSGQKNYVGGIAGMIYGASSVTNIMNKCWSGATVENRVTGSNNSTGGLAGNVHTVTLEMTDCLSTGTLKAEGAADAPGVGGFVGRVQGPVKITRGLNLRTINVKGDGASMTVKSYGSFVGRADKTVTLTNAYVADNVNVSIGYPVQGSEVATITNAGALKGDNAKTVLKNFDFLNNWKAVKDSTPELLLTLEQSEDINWYIDEAKNRVYELSAPAQLKGFLVLSKDRDFSGQTIKLTADITLNDVTISEVTDYSGLYKWEPIGKSKAFAGTFDGGLHTISGLYCNESTVHAGLFGQLSATASVKNLKITNSYFNSTATNEAKIGAVVGYSLAKELSSIYVDATVKVSGQKNYVGGIAGMIYGTAGVANEMNKCWSGATVENTSGSNNSTGGLVGNVHTVTLEMTDCLSTGTLKAEGAADAPGVGGFVGRAQGPVKITRGLNLRTIDVKGDGASMTVKSYGSFVGRADKTVTLTNAYIADNVNVSIGYPVQGSEVATITNAGALKGDNAKTVLKNFDFLNNWKTITGSTPVLAWTVSQ